MSAEIKSCLICKNTVGFLGEKEGLLDQRHYKYFHCDACRFSFISNPRTDYGTVYSKEYYAGKGADPIVNYTYELENPSSTIRYYEWQGLVTLFKKLLPEGGRWLDFGCGTGGLIRFAKKQGIDCVGFDEGYGAELARLKNIPVLTEHELKASGQKFDFVSAIEVIEHSPDPLAMLRLIRSVLKPGGILFLTTGNAKPWRKRLLQWRYASIPDVHISFFEPKTLALAFQKTGFLARENSFSMGFAHIIKFKVLNTLGVKNRHFFIDSFPWYLMSKIADLRYHVSKQPYAVAVEENE